MAVFDGKKMARSIAASYIVVNYTHAISKSIFPRFSPKSSNVLGDPLKSIIV